MRNLIGGAEEWISKNKFGKFKRIPYICILKSKTAENVHIIYDSG